MAGREPGEAGPRGRGGQAPDITKDEFATPHFRMYHFKVTRCPRVRPHDWTQCPYAHPGEKAKRRDPRRYKYTGQACPDFRKASSCRRGDACPYAHGVFECWLHPTRYRTQDCADGDRCTRRVCFFAHNDSERRNPHEDLLMSIEAMAEQAYQMRAANLLPPRLASTSSGPMPMTEQDFEQQQQIRALQLHALYERIAAAQEQQLGVRPPLPPPPARPDWPADPGQPSPSSTMSLQAAWAATQQLVTQQAEADLGHVQRGSFDFGRTAFSPRRFSIDSMMDTPEVPTPGRTLVRAQSASPSAACWDTQGTTRGSTADPVEGATSAVQLSPTTHQGPFLRYPY